MIETWNDRLDYAMSAREVKSSRLAAAVGVSSATVSDWRKGNIKTMEATNAAKVCDFLCISLTWLFLKKGPSGLENESPVQNPHIYNVENGPDVKGYVPVISWVQAGDWSEIVDNFQPGDADEWMPCPVSHTQQTYALRVRGVSMYNQYERTTFHEGDIIFVDPNKHPENGSLVVVRLDDAKEATFKKLVIEGGKQYLRALNPSWPEPIIEINGNATICGVVIFKGEKI